MKKIITIICIVLLVPFSFGFSSSYENIGLGIDQSFDENFSVRSYDACNGYPSHDMLPSGIGNVFLGTYPDNSNMVIHNGACWQCSRCHQVLITEFDPLITNYVGKYGLWNPGYVISGVGTNMYVSNVHFSATGSIPYFTFRYTR